MTVGNSMYSGGEHRSTEMDAAMPGVKGAPNEAALLELMSRTGYSMLQENGQRKYGGPPPGWEGPPPPRGCEIFIGKIPRDCYEDELIPLFEKIGYIYEFRLMMDFSGSNRGYAFVMYTKKEDAITAVKEMNNYELRKGRLLGVCPSVDNCRLFVGGIPKSKQRDEILTEMKKVTEGVVDVIVYPSANDKSKNRGFAFVEYESHRAAAMARRKLIPGRIQLWGHQIAVDWAEPEQEVDDDIMAAVKVLYVRNLMLSTTEETIQETFSKPSGNASAVERVKKIRDYAFVHFKDRSDALTAKDELNGSTFDGSLIEVVLAKPVDKNDYVRYTRGAKEAFPQDESDEEDVSKLDMMDLMETLPYGFGYEAAPYGGAPGVYQGQYTISAAGRGFQPRGAIGFRGMIRGRGRGAAGSRGAGGRNYSQGFINMPRHHPSEVRLFEILPGMELTLTNPQTLKPQSMKSPIQVLEEHCQKNGWGSPVYTLHSTMTPGGDIQLFLYKVMIPALAATQNPNAFQATKLCRTPDEAKVYAAEYVLMQLGIPYEGADVSVVTTLVSPSPSLYQGRPIGPTTYSLTNGQRSDLTSSVPVVTSTSYVVAPGKLPPTPADYGNIYEYPPAHYASAGPVEMYHQY